MPDKAAQDFNNVNIVKVSVGRLFCGKIVASYTDSCSYTDLIFSELLSFMKAGDRVRVSTPVVLYHHPKHRNQPHNAEGMEGTIKEVLTDWQGRPISPNFPVVVEFAIDGAKRPFKAHMANTELEMV